MPYQVAPAEISARRWVVVDVETSGLYPGSCRVLSLAALPLDSEGHPDGEPFVSLINGDCDPGPVHIHGLSAQRLAGAPRFVEVLPQLLEVLDGRVLVAHNAAFDFGFLTAEADRSRVVLPTRHRLCTLALSRRLGIDMPNHQLGTLATYWGVPQRHAHDAHDDARVLSGVFRPSLLLAAELDLPLPLVICDGSVHGGYPRRPITAPCPWRYPGRLGPGGPLVQGMKIVITGDTRLPREQLAQRLTSAGLEVLPSISRLTSVLVCNPCSIGGRKVARARTEATPMIDEATLITLLDDVRSGEPKTSAIRPRSTRTAVAPPRGPLTGHRVLVLGGTHSDAARIRAAVSDRGAAVAVNLTVSVTDLILLPGGERDPRLARAGAAGVTVHHDLTILGIQEIHNAGAVAPPPTPQPAAPTDGASASTTPAQLLRTPATPVLARGVVIDLPDQPIWTINAAWRADALVSGVEVDVVAFLVDHDEKVVSDEDLVFYNAPTTPDGAVTLSVDGDSEQSIRVDLNLVADDHTKIVIAAALSARTTFGDLGAVALSIDSASAIAATATLDAATTERTLLLAEVYRRRDHWRVRAIGQGYDDGLAELATRYGVSVE